MPRGYRLFCVALVGWLILAGATEGNHSHRDQAKRPSQNQQGNPAPMPLKKAPSAQPTQADDGNCKGAYDESKSCNAIAADAAVDQASYAFWQTVAAWIIGSGTLLAAILAARWAKKAAEETERGAKAALDAVGETREATKAMQQANHISAAAQRAWLAIDVEMLKVEVISFADLVTFSMDVMFKNIGQTVAKQVFFSSAFVESGESTYEKERKIFQMHRDLRSDEGITIIPGETRRFRTDISFSHKGLCVANNAKKFCPTLYAFCDYLIETDVERRKADSSFLLVMCQRSGILDIGIRVDPMPDADEMEFVGGSLVAT